MKSSLEGVVLRPIAQFRDARGWLMEVFRDDDLPGGVKPVMGYISLTHPGVARGPHEHKEQTDVFAFLSGTFRLYLWENRPGREEVREVLEVGVNNPVVVVVPPGVVHAYKNIGPEDALVLNFPDALYAGWGKKEPVDEIRHEDDGGSRFEMD